MPAATKPVTFSWVPKGAGKGGQFSNATSHSVDTDSLATVSEYLVDGGKWIIKPLNTTFGYTGGLGPEAPDSLAIFNYYNATTGTFEDYLLYSIFDAVALKQSMGYFDTAGTSHVLTYDTYPTNTPMPWTFQMVKNKAYLSNGWGGKLPGTTSGPLMVYDILGTGIPPLSAAWGIKAPATNLQVTPDPASYVQGTGTVNGTASVTGLPAGFVTNLTVGMPFYIETSAGSGGFSQYIISTAVGTTVTLTTNSLEAYGVANVQANFGSMSWGSVSSNLETGTGTTAAGNTITAVSFDPTVSCKSGYTIFVETAAGTNQWSQYKILTVGASPNIITLTGPTIENYVGAKLRVDLPASQGAGSTDSSYKYAIAYYDTVRGHVGDIGPIFEVKVGAPFNNRIDLLISNICDYGITPDPHVSVWPLYDKIILYRTANDGASLQPMVLLNPAGLSPQSYSDRNADDTQLGLVAPYKPAISAGTHSAPPRDINFATYFEGRFFAASTSNPGILYWTSLFNEIGDYGVPEECWNSLNTIPIPNSDGSITGIKVIGSALLVLTQNNIYQVLYNTTGNIPIFRLQRISAKGSGTSQFATAMLPGEDSNSGDILVHFGNDSRLYLLYGQGGDIPISYPIQDVLNQSAIWANSKNVTLGIWHDKRATYIFMTCNRLANTFLYDLDRKIWLNFYTPYSAFTEGLFDGKMTAFVGTLYTTVLKFMDDTVNIPLISSNLIGTHYISAPGVNRMDEKRLDAVVIYGYGWANPTVTAYLDEKNWIPIPFTQITTSLDPRFAAYLDAPDTMLFVPQGNITSCRTSQITFTGTPNFLWPYVSEIKAIWSVTVDEASTGGII